MDGILRPQFGQPCFDDCGATVPTQRVERLKAAAAEAGRAFLKSDVVCVDCAKKRAAEERRAFAGRSRR
jgi:hypothetical protein